MRRDASAAFDALLAHVAQEIAGRRLAEVVVVALLLQRRVDALGIGVGPVRQQHDVLAIGRKTLAVARLDDDRAVQADLFLKPRMAVIPVRAGLVHREAVRVRLARRDAHEAQARHAVHVGRQDDAVPVDRASHRQRVADAQRHRVALAPAQQRRRQLAVDDRRATHRAGEIDRHLADRQIELAAA